QEEIVVLNTPPKISRLSDNEIKRMRKRNVPFNIERLTKTRAFVIHENKQIYVRIFSCIIPGMGAEKNYFFRCIQFGDSLCKGFYFSDRSHPACNNFFK